jgi:hypothetical protein
MRNFPVVAITVLFAPTTITLTSDSTVDLDAIVRPRQSTTSKEEMNGNPAVNNDAKENHEKLEIILPERLVIMANHQVSWCKRGSVTEGALWGYDIGRTGNRVG